MQVRKRFISRVVDIRTDGGDARVHWFCKTKPHHYNSCLSALCLARSDGAPEKAKILLTKMQDNGLADTLSYNTMMKAYLERCPSNQAI